MSSATIWYAARGAGIVAYLLVTATVLVGVTLAGRRVRFLPRFALEDVHRFLGLLAGVFVTIHVAGIALDTVVPFSLAQLVVPFTAQYRPVWTGLGVVALELLVALAITNRLRRRLPYRVWRALHAGSFAVWTLATVHGVLAGTDRDTAWARLLYGAATLAIVTAVTIRLGRRASVSAALPAGLALGAAAAGAVVVASTSPMPAPSRSPTTSPSAPTELGSPFTGSVDERDGEDAVLVSVAGTAGSNQETAIRIDLLQTSDRVDTSLQVLFPDGTGCTGTITAIDPSGFDGSCLTPTGSERRIEGEWDLAGGQVSGTIDVTARTAASTADT